MQRFIETITQFKKPFDYIAYKEAYTQYGESSFMDIRAYYTTVGIIMGAKDLYPDLNYVDAYNAFNNDMNPKPIESNQSQGLGDTIAKITHATGLDKLAELYTNITGKDCGCHSRQEALNKLVPYGVKENE